MNPSLKTMAKYGLDFDRYRTVWDRQRGKCGCCQKPFGKFMVFIDHEHVKGFSSMTADDKRKHVRGLLCYMCNRFKVCKNDLTSARAVVRYLEQGRTWTTPDTTTGRTNDGRASEADDWNT